MYSKEVLQQLSTEEKKALLRKLMEQGEKTWPLSFGQEALWFLQHRTPENHAYNVAACIEIESPLKADYFYEALRVVVARHPQLRAHFEMDSGKLRQVINDEASFHWEIENVEGYGIEMLDAAITANYQEPFDLSCAPLVRANLYKRAETEWYFLLCVHHIALDGWSLWQILAEIQQCYSLLLEGKSPNLPAVSASYKDFIIRQRSLVNGKQGEQQLAYWLRELAGDLPTLQLPLDKPRPPQQTFNGGGYTQSFSKEFSEQYKRFCRERCVTPFVMGLACYFVLLHRYSNQDELLVATPSAGRNGEAFMDVVGYFVNPLPIRASLENDPCFVDFLKLVKSKTDGALENQDIPFPLIVEKLKAVRDPSYPVLCQAMFVYQKLRSAPNTIGFDKGLYTWGALRAKHYPLHQQEGQFDIALEILEGENTLEAHWKFNRDLFDAASIERMSVAFEQLILHVMDKPGLSVSELELISRFESAKLRRPPQQRFTVNQCLHERFEEVAQQFPENVAVVCEGERVTYRELSKRSSAIAGLLLQKGLQRGEAVGVSLQRSVDLVASLLGVLKAGACYIPLDPTYPVDRLHYMAEDAAIRFVVTNKASDNSFNARHVERVYVDAINVSARNQAVALPKVEADALTYILYTSGSTGRPKGVKVTHKNVQRLFSATQSLYQFSEHDSWTLFHSYAFDFSVWEIWGALLFGGKLVVVPYEVSRTPDAFHQLLEQEKVTVLNQTPSAFQQLVRADLARGGPENKKQLDHLKWVIFGGEALDFQSLSPWFDKYDDAQPTLVNMYGITETTVHVTYRKLCKSDAHNPQSVIGQPLEDLHILILDKHLNVVPVGVPGEIYVGGAGVSLGYHNRNELTEEKFISNPLLPGEKLYRSGDLARWVNEKDIAYLGRIDHQVQLRGFRIELGEIENQISSLPAVATSFVMVREDNPGDARLVAYYILQDNCELSWREIKQHLQTALPDYMVPASGVVMDAFPLTDNGKIDRKALPKPNMVLNLGADKPRDLLERKIANLWCEVLALSTIGIHDNFFELGGHSLLAAQLIEKLKVELRQTLSLSQLMRNPTVAKLAQSLRETGSQSGQWEPLIPLKTQGTKAPLFCIPGGSGNSLYFQPFSAALGNQRPVYGIQARGLDGEHAPLTSVEAMASDNIRALRSVQKHGPYYLLGHCFGAVVAYEMAKQLKDMGEEVARLIVLDAPAPFPEHRPPCINWSQSRWLRYFVNVLEESTGIKAGFDEEQFAALEFETQLQQCKEYMEVAGILPSDSHINQVTGLVNVFRNNSQTLYQPTILKGIPLTVVRASEAHPVYDYSAADDHHDIRYSSLGWKKVADKTLEIKCVPGHHISMLTEPNVQTLAVAVELTLSQIQSQQSRSPVSSQSPDQNISTNSEIHVSDVVDTVLVN